MSENFYIDFRISPPRGPLPPPNLSPPVSLMVFDHESDSDSNAEGNNRDRPIRTLRDYFQPPRGTSNSCIGLPINQTGIFTFKPGMLQHIP